jgi:hypothetical protein
MANTNEIHFYPGARKMGVFGWRSGRRIPLFVIDAVGGPPTMGTDPLMPERPTTAGRFVIGKIHAYRTPSWSFSQIPWGTKLRDMKAKGDVWYQLTNKNWASIKADCGITRTEIIQENYRLYGDLKVPDVWVFNDFGPLAIRYFEDKNNNRKLDAHEQLSGEMIHTTPVDEAATSRGQAFTLSESHGCVHIRPEDRTRLMSAGVFNIGTPFIVHAYSDAFPNVGTP